MELKQALLMIPFKATPELPPSNLIFNHFYQLNTKNIIKENHLSPDLSLNKELLFNYFQMTKQEQIISIITL